MARSLRTGSVNLNLKKKKGPGSHTTVATVPPVSILVLLNLARHKADERSHLIKVGNTNISVE
jgi:hypothetical protein